MLVARYSWISGRRSIRAPGQFQRTARVRSRDEAEGRHLAMSALVATRGASRGTASRRLRMQAKRRAAAPAQQPRRHCPVSKLHCAPPPAFCMISFGSSVQRSLETLSMLEPAAPSAGMPAAAIVAPTSLASRPVSVRLRAPKLSSQLREVISTLLTRQVTDSASTEIFLLGVKQKLVLPRNSRAMTRLSNARTAGECCAITAANAKPLGPLALPGAADAVVCTTVSAKAAIKAGMISVFIGAASVRDTSALGDLTGKVIDRCAL